MTGDGAKVCVIDRVSHTPLVKGQLLSLDLQGRFASFPLAEAIRYAESVEVA